MVRINLLPVRVSRKKEAGKQQLILFALVLVLGVLGNYLWAASRAGALARASGEASPGRGARSRSSTGSSAR